MNEHAASAATALDRAPAPVPAVDEGPPQPPSRTRLIGLLTFQLVMFAGAIWTVAPERHPVSFNGLFWSAAILAWLVAAGRTALRLRAQN